jgi:hypothetical protein
MIARFGKIVVCCMRREQITAASAGNVVDGGDGAGRNVCFAAAPCRESRYARSVQSRQPSTLVPRNGTAGRVRQATARASPGSLAALGAAAASVQSVQSVQTVSCLVARGAVPQRACYRNGAVPA